MPADADHPGLVTALRLQLAGRAEVVAGAPLTGGTREARIDEVSRMLTATGARFVVWIDREAVHLQGGNGDESVSIPLPDVAPADANRVLALKIRSAIESLTLVSEPPGSPGPRETGWLTLEAALTGGWRTAGQDPELEVGVAARWRALPAAPALEAVASVGYALPTHDSGRVGRTTFQQFGASVGVRGGLALGPLTIDAQVDAGIRLVTSTWVEFDGPKKSGAQIVPGLGASLGVRLPLGHRLGVRFAVGIDRSLTHPFFRHTDDAGLPKETVRGPGGTRLTGRISFDYALMSAR